jgi:hypothetical protein
MLGMPARFCRASSLALFLIFLVWTAGGQKSADGPSRAARAYLDQALDLMQKTALYRESINWSQLRAETLARATNARTTIDTYPAIAFALTQLKEHHSFLEPPDNLAAAQRLEIVAEMQKVKGPGPAPNRRSPFAARKKILGHLDRHAEKRFAHVVVPMFIPPYAEDEKNQADSQKFADQLHALVVQLHAQEPDGWVIDLRGNGGGDMWPMLAGIGAVLGEGDVGAFVYPDGKREPWFYKRGQAGTRPSGSEQEIGSQIKQQPFAFREVSWVAVLFDRGTGSSGEALAICFAGRPRERSFGEHTANYSTANEDETLSDGAVLHLSVGVYADRTGRQYPEGIDPDAGVRSPDHRPTEGNDLVLHAAEDWLAAQTAVSR